MRNEGRGKPGLGQTSAIWETEGERGVMSKWHIWNQDRSPENEERGPPGGAAGSMRTWGAISWAP